MEMSVARDEHLNNLGFTGHVPSARSSFGPQRHTDDVGKCASASTETCLKISYRFTSVGLLDTRRTTTTDKARATDDAGLFLIADHCHRLMVRTMLNNL